MLSNKEIILIFITIKCHENGVMAQKPDGIEVKIILADNSHIRI